GTSSVNGQTGSGTVTTGGGGCTVASVTTSGVVAAGLQLRFSFGSGLTATVIVDPPGAVSLTATPNPIIVGPGSGTASTLLCVRAGGDPIAGVAIELTGCTAAAPGVLQGFG